MDRVIKVEKKTHYGTTFIYPANDQAENICRLLNGQKSLTADNLKNLKTMGFMIKEVVRAGDRLVDVGEL